MMPEGTAVFDVGRRSLSFRPRRREPPGAGDPGAHGGPARGRRQRGDTLTYALSAKGGQAFDEWHCVCGTDRDGRRAARPQLRRQEGDRARSSGRSASPTSRSSFGRPAAARASATARSSRRSARGLSSSSSSSDPRRAACSSSFTTTRRPWPTSSRRRPRSASWSASGGSRRPRCRLLRCRQRLRRRPRRLPAAASTPEAAAPSPAPAPASAPVSGGDREWLAPLHASGDPSGL